MPKNGGGGGGGCNSEQGVTARQYGTTILHVWVQYANKGYHVKHWPHTYTVIILIKVPPGNFAEKDAYKFALLAYASVQVVVAP